MSKNLIKDIPHLSKLCCSVLGLPGPRALLVIVRYYFSFDEETFVFLFSVNFQTTENRENQVFE